MIRSIKGKLMSTKSKSTKQDIVIALIKRQNGATLGEITKATGWKPHSARGVISGVLKKRLGLNVTTTKGVGGTVYHLESKASA
jgi:hypothetical protein